MLNLIKKVKGKLVKIYKDLRVIKYYKKDKMSNNGPIVFLCQFESIWNKSESVFLKLCEKGCNCKLLVINDKISFDNEKTIFERKYPDKVIYYKNGILNELHPSVVFYSRPYDNYLPCDLKSYSVIKKFNTAFIPYYYALETDYKFSINDNFIRNITYFFADQESTKKYFDSRRKRLINKGYQHSYNFGYPALEDIILKIDENKICDNFIYKNKNRINVMWTPRWTIDEKLGGSNFLKYYKDIFRTFNNNSKYSFVFRPHPMLFSNFLDNNFITHEEYNLIIKQFKESDNMIYDNSSEYFNTFINTDVLISDNSSIIIEYLLTGKPMIYCFNKSNFVFNEIMNELLDVNYIVNNFDELSTVLGKLTNGIDPKKNKRIELINKIKNENRDASNSIATVIKNEIIDKK